MTGQSDLQLQPEKFEEVNNGKDFLRKIKDEDNSDLSFWGVDSEAKKSKYDKNSLRNIRTGLDSPILKRDSHTRPCSLEMLPPAEKVEEEDIVDFQRVVESFSSSFPFFQMRMERSAVDKAFILVRILALSFDIIIGCQILVSLCPNRLQIVLEKPIPI